ncbi:MAG: glucoamylase family protein [Pseudoflavonifractor sp.]|nr:glucoamylase family protein [Pseudoflavonifractor sp.]
MDRMELGRETAHGLRPAGQTTGRRAAKEIVRSIEQVERTRDRIARQSRERLPQAAEWLLDNAYLARRGGLESAEDLRRGRGLRTVGGVLYVQFLARTFARETTEVLPEELALFLAGVQSVQSLTEAELALFISALKGELCRMIAELCPSLEAEAEREGLAETLEKIFTGLRFLSTANLGPLLEASSSVETALRKDPAGLYSEMDDATRARYRNRVCQLARRYRKGEQETAEEVLALARGAEGERAHIGWFLFRCPLGKQEKRSTGTLYVASVLLPALFLALLLGFLLESRALFFLLLLPATDLTKNLVDFLMVRLVRPRPVLRMELQNGLPREGRTLCVIAGLLTGEDSGDQYAALLERYRLANRDCGEELRFGLLADLPDRAAPMASAQRRQIRRAEQAIKALNDKYGGGFYLFFRTPVFQKTDERYVGWERKRGALIELSRLLRGKPTGLRVRAGDAGALSGTKYVITLDSDTTLNVGTARELVGAMLHPLNRPVVDARLRVVTEGYGLLQPRVGVELNAANRSQFSRIFAGQGGVDPYGGACSDVYHDLFDRGTYTGKGIFDVEVFGRCLDGRFPQERILSHDLLEGAYLHAGLLGDVELTDGYPYKVNSYFARLHRWVRGDWQLLPWLGRRVHNEAGERVTNPIAPMDKWKIFDNLRRSLSPAFTLLALLLGMCLSAPAFGTAAALAIVSAWSNLLLTGADLAFRGGVGLRRRYHSTIIAGFGGMILQTLVQLLFLPYQAWVCASAAAAALWRSFVSHQRMLEWVTAADAEGRKDGVWANFRAQWPAVAAGLFAMAFARFPAGAAVGLVWAFSPAFAWALSRPVREKKAAPEEDRPFLLHQAALIWGYFQDWLRPEDHWLPPDNVQEKPWLGPARRTSPTNIGMALLSCCAAADLELTSRRRAVELIGHMLDTVEALPKWNGHLYNWYDTSDCAPLWPRYVSTVDSGNLRGCLIALREALYTWGEDRMARRAECLSNAMDLSPLYDRERKLFTIGFDVEREVFTQGWYDLMASEARLSSYLGVALGEVDPRHWRRLGRMLVEDNDYCGMASWTGTMFEYFMPNLLLPCEQGSLMYESLAFCIYAQKRRGAKTGTPWGISESGFFAFDPGMAYQYKAHGVQALGLKRGLDRELVVAPYASFLALLLAPGSAGRNLRRLRDMGLEGTYGLYEAADFTRGRVRDGEKWAAVRSFMSHHLGMSLIAIDNALSGNIMQERFMQDCSMAAYRELLQEKVPVGAPVMKPSRTFQPDRVRPARQSEFHREGEVREDGQPVCHLLSNGLVSALCTGDGAVRLTDERGESPVLTVLRERFSPTGVSFFFRNKEGQLYPLTSAPLWREGQFSWSFDGAGVCWKAQNSVFTAKVALTLSKEERGALWSVYLDGGSGGELICYLEPVLARSADYLAHPAYSKLSLESTQLECGVRFVRRPREGKRQAALAIVWDREESSWDTSRERALGRGGLRRLEQALETPAGSTEGAVLDPCLLARFPVGEDHIQLRVALGFEDGAERAEKTAREVLNSPGESSGRLPGLLRALQMTTEEGKRAMDLLSALAFTRQPTDEFPQSDLWVHGISGDLPIVLASPEPEGESLSAFPLKAHALLSHSGFPFDLVYPLTDGSDYRRPVRGAVLELVKTLGMEAELGRRGGIYLIDIGLTGEGEGPLAGWSAVRLNSAGRWILPEVLPPIRPQLPPCRVQPGLPEGRYLPEGEYAFRLEGTLPPLGWSHFLVNPAFGWLTDETGCGHLWQGNSRESAITPWNNDPLAIGGPEWFYLTWKGETHSLFADGDSLSVSVTYGFGWARWEKEWPGGTVRTTALVPWDEPRRLLLVELPDGDGEISHISNEKGDKPYKFSGSILLSSGAEGTQEAALEEWESRFRDTTARWRQMVCPLRVETPDPALNHYLNGWCLYQVVACRLLARTSHYQNGGAFGFRDQLQDTLGLLTVEPSWCRAQILRCCAHQFQEGDVQHWWHEVDQEKNRGVRTRISDDLLWLPYALARYCESWNDWNILSEQVNYLSGHMLKEGEAERYFVPEAAREAESVYRHAVRALNCALDRGTGSHGLMKMGTGDWNDGMNRVGAGGQGESVWLTWFTAVTLQLFAPIAERMNDGESAGLFRGAAGRLKQAAENAWDGAWYLRGWYDDGTPLGSGSALECQIDSIAQSWAALTPGVDRTRAETAMRSALDRLFDREVGVVCLFTPPFREGETDPGYIRGYVPGVRENGGQYTHAAVWLVLACYELGWNEEGWDLLQTLLPETHPTEVYRAEPYVLAGDVYTNLNHPGRGGWSWYTGAAGWYYQAAISGLFGITVKDQCLSVSPKLPSGWPGYSARWEGKGWTLLLTVCRGKTPSLLLDGGPVTLVSLEGLTGEHRLDATICE